jgi:hypothetical protein
VRKPVTRALKVWPGDKVVIRASLPFAATLGRLVVFAAEGVGAEFSPYVPDLAEHLALDGPPPLLTPLSLRLTDSQPIRIISFVSDIAARIRVFQEIDTDRDLLAKVEIRRHADRQLPWPTRLSRNIESWF